MSIVGYLINIDTAKFEKLNKVLARKITSATGYPLQPTSSTKAFMSLDSYKALIAEVGNDKLGKYLKDHGAELSETVTEQQALAHIQTRDPADVPDRPADEQPPKVDPHTGKRVDWHIVESHIHDAWQLLGGPDNINWKDVVVGHIDTGFTLHPVLGFTGGNLNSPWVDTARDRNFFSKEIGYQGEGGATGSHFASLDSAEDTLGGMSHGHGTRTLSILCGLDTSSASKNSSIPQSSYSGYFGVAPKVPVVPIRVEDSIWIQNELGKGLPEAINYLVESAGVQVISLSMGSPRFFLSGYGVPRELTRALSKAYSRGVIVVCAAGNHIPNEAVVYPARLPRTIAVGGSAPKGTPWSGSSFGVQVDISAPAFPIRRATTQRGNRFLYGVGDGTSFATPQVAGTAAMWLTHRYDEIEAAYKQPWQRVEAFLTLLKSTATAPNGWQKRLHGAGILNAGDLLAADLPPAEALVRNTEESED